MSHPKILIQANFNTISNAEKSIVGNNFEDTLSSHAFVSSPYPNVDALYFKAPLGGDNFKQTIALPNECCIEMWIRTDGWGMVNTVVSDAGIHAAFFRDDLSPQMCTIRFQNGIGIRCHLLATTGGQSLLDVTNQTLLASTWYHIAHTYSSANSIHKIFLTPESNKGPAVEVGSKAHVFTMSGATDFIFSIGRRANVGASIFELDGYTPGVKVSKRFKLDFTDRFDWRRELQDVV